MVDRLSPPIPRARILVVEDERGTRMAVGRALGLLGYEVDEATSGSEALAKVASTPYDLMLLDLRLPGVDGLQVMEEVQGTRPYLLVIVLTAHATLESAIAAVKAGAVDYLLKPCSNKEIGAAVARALEGRRAGLIRNHLLRAIAEAVDALRADSAHQKVALAPPRERFLECGSLMLDRERRLLVTVLGDAATGRSVELTPGEGALLACLMQQPEVVLSCSELAREAFGYSVSEAEAKDIVRPHICRLRRKVEREPDNPSLIRTVRGRGYLLSLL